MKHAIEAVRRSAVVTVVASFTTCFPYSYASVWFGFVSFYECLKAPLCNFVHVRKRQIELNPLFGIDSRTNTHAYRKRNHTNDNVVVAVAVVVSSISNSNSKQRVLCCTVYSKHTCALYKLDKWSEASEKAKTSKLERRDRMYRIHSSMKLNESVSIPLVWLLYIMDIHFDGLIQPKDSLYKSLRYPEQIHRQKTTIAIYGNFGQFRYERISPAIHPFIESK